MFCPFCGTDNASDQKYCRNCGAMLPVATKASSKPSATGTKKNSVGFPTGTNSLSSAGTSSFVPPQPPNLPKPAKSLPLPSLNEAVGSKRKEEVAPPDAPALDSSKNMGHQPTVNLNDADDFDPNSLLESFYETQPTFNASLNRQKIDPSKHPDVGKAFVPPPPPPPLPSSTPVSKAGTFIPETTGMPRLEEVVDSTIQMASVSADEALLESLSTTAVPVSTSQKNTPPPAESENKKKDEKASFSKTLIGHPMSDPLKQSEITLDAPVGDASAGATNHFGSLAGDKGASSPETLFMDVPPFRDEDDTETIPSARLSDIFGNVAIPGLSKNFAIPGPPPPPPPPTSVGIDTAGSAEEQNLETLVLNKSELKDVEDAAMKAAATTLMAPSNVTNSSAGSLDSPTTVYMPPNNPRQFDEATEVLKNSPIKDETTDELDKKTRVSLPKPEGFALDVASTIAMPSLSEPDTESYPEVMQQSEIRQRMEAEAQMQMPVNRQTNLQRVDIWSTCAFLM
ncbi:MAG: zinc ribbon domain-containing protein, partial [Blastocatellia bacterium]|nr:zinc ribbon domain-containing protein [Blastocatellia bacterium]